MCYYVGVIGYLKNGVFYTALFTKIYEVVGF